MRGLSEVGDAVSGSSIRRVYLHIGEPKTGTTFVQDVLWGNWVRLSSRGVLLPGYSNSDHSLASRDLRETPRAAGDPAVSWTGDWDVLIRQALRCRDRAVISSELLAAASPQQAERAVRSLLRAEVHVVATVRDFASALSAEWQESVKCRGTAPWDEWLADVITATHAEHRRRESWFWRVHDTLSVLEMWSRHIPPDHVHVITVPRRQSAGVLWERFAAVVGLDAAGFDLSGARRNSSLGLVETEFLRRLNAVLPANVPNWFYSREIKQVLGHGVLSGRSAGSGRSLPALGPGQREWASEQADLVIAGLRGAKYEIAGDLAELIPEAELAPPAAAASDGQLLDAALGAAVALNGRCFQVMYPDRLPRPHGSARELAALLTWRLLNGPRVRRALRGASHHAAVRRLRLVIWCVLTHPGRPPGSRQAPAGQTDAQT
jgi:hypothetical protein